VAGSIGSVSITVDADASGVPSDIEKATKAPLAKIGESMGKALSASLAAAVDTKSASAALQAGFVSALGSVKSATLSLLSPVTQLGQNFVAGFTNASAAASSFTGKIGTLGGALGKALGVSGFQNFAAGFRSVDAALSSTTGKLGTIGGVARTAWNVASTAAQGFASVVGPVFSKVTSLASAAWDKIRSGASAAFSAIGESMKGTLESAARLTGAGVATVLGAALTKGFGRLEAIDTATAKLTGLGVTGDQLAATMNAATNAVRGTSFGLGEAASAAASFSAAGVPIDGMERSLRILASTAAVGGSSLSEMGTIFGKVAATGKVNGEVLQQLAERGVPALSLLAKQMGVTAEEASKMVSSGEVDFETFQAAMEAGLGPAAQAMGQSFSGMAANVSAALGRLGAAAQQPAFNALKTLFPALISLLDQFTAAVTPVATVIGEALAPAAQKLAGFLSGINFQVTADGATSFMAALGPLLPIVGGLLGLLGPMLANLPVIGGLFSSITGPVGLFAGALVALLAIDPTTLLAGFDSIASALPGIFTTLVSKAAELVPQMVERIATNLPIFVTGILNLFMALIPALTAAIPMIVQTFATLIPTLITTLLGAIPTILAAALQLFSGIITAIITVLPQIVQSLVAMLPQVAQAIITALPQIISAALELFMGVITGLVEATPVIIAAVLDLLPELITTLLGMLPTIIESALELFLGIVTGLLTAIPDIIIALLEMLPQLISTLLGMIPTLIQGAVQLFTGLVEALPVIIPKLIDALTRLGPTMVDTLIGLIPVLLQAGVDLVGGLVTGLWEAAGSVGSALLEIAQNAIGDFLSFLGIASPSKLFAGYGANLGQGLAKGIHGSLGLVTAAMDEMSNAAVAALPPVLNGSISPNSTSLAPGNGATASPTSTDNRRSTTFAEGAFQLSGPDPRKIALETADAIAEEAGR